MAVGLLAPLVGALTLPYAVGIAFYGAVMAVLLQRHPEWQVSAQASDVAALSFVALSLGRGHWWIALLPLTAVAGNLLLTLRRLHGGLLDAQRARAETASQLDRRISELFSLQELSYVLSESLQPERIVEQVTRFTQRFLQADGALVALIEEEGDGEMPHPPPRLRIVAAEGSLNSLAGQARTESESSLILEAIGRERMETALGPDRNPTLLLWGTHVRSAAAVPLRAHGVTLGALAVVDGRHSAFSAEDLWLLSTVATHTAVVLANSRFFEMIRRGKEEWETTFDALADGIAVVDDQGRIRRANRATAQLVGQPPPAIIDQPFCPLLVGRSQAAIDLIDGALSGKRPSPRVVQSETTKRSLRLTAAPLAEKSAAGSVVVLIEDVTEQLALERQLIQNERLRAVGQLVSGVAHELNNPLTSIAGLSEFLLEQAQVSEADRQHLRVIHDQAERAGRIVQNLLVFARKGLPEKAGIDVNNLAARTALLVAYDLKLRRVELERRVSPEAVTVLGDQYELQQVLLNLLTNAAHAVSQLPEDAERRIILETARDLGTVLVRVRDTGPGVAPELQPHLFSPFFTTKQPGEGTGLGLSISYGIIQSHDGTLSYAPGPEGGAEFTIALPFYSLRASAVQGTDTDRHGTQIELPVAHGPRRSVLLVDNDPAIHEAVAAVFREQGHDVDAARNGEYGLRLARQKGYDLVIADERAAAGPGKPFAEAFVREHPERRHQLLVATADARVESEERLRRQGYWVIRKPFSPRELREAAATAFKVREKR